MNDRYVYEGPSTRSEGKRQILAAGDYDFKILEVDDPYSKVVDGRTKWILKVKIEIQPHGVTLFYRPWVWAKRREGERDSIGDLFFGVNRAPQVGEEPDYGRLIGARGRLRLKVGSYQDQETNEVHWIHRPKQLGQQPASSGQSFTESEIQKSQQTIAKVLGQSPSEENLEPDDIPF